MKKIVSFILIFSLVLGLLSGCRGASSDGDVRIGEEGSGNIIIRIGATPVPHQEILEYIAPFLLEDGIILEIVPFTEYPLVNPAVADGSIDANYFQHRPYLNAFLENTNNDLRIVGDVHVEPLGAYSRRWSNISELPQGATIAMPNDAPNGGRSLMLLEYHGLIELNPAEGVLATVEDIISNPLGLEILTFDAALLPRVLVDDQADLVIVNTNHLLAGTNFTPRNDSLIIESLENNPYANMLVTRPELVNHPAMLTLLRHMQSERVREFILTNYDGVEPAF